MVRTVRIANLVTMFLVVLAGLSSFTKQSTDGAALAGALIATVVCFYPLYVSWSALGNREHRKLKRAFAANIVGICFFVILALAVIILPDRNKTAFFVGALILGTPFIVNAITIRRMLANGFPAKANDDADAPSPTSADTEPAFIDMAEVPQTSTNYLLRHWRGELPLGLSYWVNGTLISISAALFITVVTRYVDAQDHSLRTNATMGLVLIAASLLVWLWSVVGIWRSAGKHRSRGGSSFWSGMARLMVVIGVLAIGGRIATTIGPQAKELALIAVGNDPMGSVEVKLSNDKRSLIIDGALREGTVLQLKKVLDENPDVRVIVLNSYGGRILEAKQIATLVQGRKLDTYVQGRCESACTFVFLAGRDRASTPNARIGFHQPSFIGLDADAQKKATEEMAKTYRQARLPDAFIKRISTTPPSDMWYPTRDELIAANVVTRLSLGGEVSVVGTAITSRNELLLAMRTVPIWQAVEKRYPDMLNEAIDLGWAAREKGGSDGEMTNAMRSVIARIYPLLLKNADDTILNEFLDVLIYQMTAARAVSAEACAKLMASQLDIAQTLPREALDKEQRFLIRAMATSPRADSDNPSRVQFERAMRSALLSLPAGHVDVIGNLAAYKDQPEVTCDASIALYRAIAALSEDERRIALRGMFQS